jgi:hypothetical protein
MGIGLIFYGVGEPLFFYLSPPPNTVEPEAAQAAAIAMGQTAFHWTLYPWAMYAIVGLGRRLRLLPPGPLAAVLLDVHRACSASAPVNGVGGQDHQHPGDPRDPVRLRLLPWAWAPCRSAAASPPRASWTR